MCVVNVAFVFYCPRANILVSGFYIPWPILAALLPLQ